MRLYELYICWAGDEAEDRNVELDQTINLNNLDVNHIQIYEKTLLVIKKAAATRELDYETFRKKKLNVDEDLPYKKTM
ncbi:hypothetical protein DOZ91_06520 [Peribacillus frigoritolerans]|nr:hypothetical protein DOZ91_06520 [Peribacillus frigoritolerans]